MYCFGRQNVQPTRISTCRFAFPTTQKGLRLLNWYIQLPCNHEYRAVWHIQRGPIVPTCRISVGFFHAQGLLKWSWFLIISERYRLTKNMLSLVVFLQKLWPSAVLIRSMSVEFLDPPFATYCTWYGIVRSVTTATSRCLCFLWCVWLIHQLTSIWTIFI